MNSTKSTYKCTHTPVEHADTVAICDICESAFADEAVVYLGTTAGGELINVSDCCRASLTTVLGEYVHADMAVGEI